MPYELAEKQVLYNGSKVRLELHHLVDPESGKRTKREVCVHPGAVAILALRGEGDDQTVLLVRNRRYAVGRSLLELPAGTLEKGEMPIDCAGRELQEETGHLAGRLRPLGTFYTSPGILSESMHAFVATDLEATRQALEEGEEIEVEERPYAEVIRLIRDGQIVDGKTIAAVLMYDRFHRDPPVPTGDDDEDAPIAVG